ncbi:alpha/beta hydrolase [Sporothrix schenckii 1099-18]|uniref:AB hydrolase-1 domain-containing protein n=2 Tax=Sporothrix schenckii TaxID=29908 RepID=U7PL78_SPOS1|nr:alpha/beta hydrolase [Sporothrix schenckii 1099-18]ERS95686.1 hypothetical protein HMPREF1624_07761 [Sporothrix schenckii ATCC 58251]KJR83702.1 alpha/beta hydrolase [Sporothrix schenckii 1099-18]
MAPSLIKGLFVAALAVSASGAAIPHTAASNTTNNATQLPLSSDSSFSYELLRTASLSRSFGADTGEVLQAAGSIVPKDLESFSGAFNKLANHVYAQAQAINATLDPVTARNAFFRASTYFRSADFYLHGNGSDPRLATFWANQTAAFNSAIALLAIPGERITLKAASGNFSIPCIYYRAEGASATDPRPTVILGNGYDGAQEEMLHATGFDALARGYNVITYEGPGQPTVRREQNLGFITEWETVVTPVVDYLLSGARPEVDGSKLGLFGYSMGGFLAVRAAAFEHRLAAVFAVDGLYSVFEPYYNALDGQVRDLWDAGNYTAFDAELDYYLASGLADTETVWSLQQGVWSFDVDTVSEFLRKTEPMTLDGGLAEQVTCPVWIGAPSEDIFFPGQPEKVRDALRPGLASYNWLTAEDAAQNHCHVGAMDHVNGLIYDWFDNVIANRVNRL